MLGQRKKEEVEKSNIDDCPVSDSVNPQDAHSPSSLEAGQLEVLKGENEPDCEPRSGTEARAEGILPDFGENDSLKSIANEIKRRHDSARVTFRSKRDYGGTWENFIRTMKLEDATIGDLKRHGKDWILQFLAGKDSKRSYRKILSSLKSYWEFGLRLPWPVSTKRDIGRLPKVGLRTTPRDERVDGWLDRIPLVNDTYDRLFLELHPEYGFRSHDQYSRLRWRHITWKLGEPVAIIAQDDEFKTSSPIVAEIPTYLRPDIKKWHKESPFNDDSDLIFPWRSCTGRIERREFGRNAIRDYWDRLQRQIGAPILTPGSFRHWAKTTMRRAGVANKLIELRQGRDPGETYDSCEVEFDLEDMEKALPNGVVGYHKRTSNKLENGAPEQWLGLYQRILSEDLKPSELLDEIYAIREQARARQEEHRIEP